VPDIFIHRSAPVARKQDTPAPVWSKTVDPADYDHAASFLALAFPAATVDACIAALKAAPIVQAAAKDILRASGSPFLDADVPGVKRQTKAIEAGQPLSPVLFIRGSSQPALDGVLADGLHRTLATYADDPEAMLPVKLAAVDWDELRKGPTQ
jgi:hypothetical protein